MNLAACRSARRREDFVMRLGCFLVTFAVLASLVLEPPRVKAFAMTSSAVTALAGGFLSACGLTPVVSGMGSSEEVNESVARLIQEYLTAELPGGVADAVEWLGQVSLTVNKTGKIIIPALVAQKLGLFAQWVAGKYGTKPGENVVYSNESITFPDGTSLMLTTGGINHLGGYNGTTFSFDTLGTSIPYGTSSNPYMIKVTDNLNLQFYQDSSSIYAKGQKVMSWNYSNVSSFKNATMTVFVYPYRSGDYFSAYGGYLLVGLVYFSKEYGRYVLSANPSLYLIDAKTLESLLSGTGLSLDVAETMQEVLDRLTALEEGQSIALDVGATQSMEIQDILQGILDAILAGDLAASAEIVDTAEAPVDPEEPDQPVVPVVPSGLDKLGAALTSRFPFSIPWDVYKGVTLLAAPPKAPYFEVDFMAPIADRVGGWKGSTKIVLDFSEYEIIGQVCRWTSTIGFCLMLASGTKRLIWTA